MKLNVDKLKSNLYPNFEFDVNKYKQGGGLSRKEDYKSKSKPYPSVDKKDFAGNNRSYTIPTKADAVDALRLAGLHDRSDVKAKVYKKYPELKKHQEGGFFNKIVKSKEYNSPLATVLKIIDPTGISSYGDVYNTWTDGKFDYNDIIEPLGAVPVFGKLGKVGKFLLKGVKGIEDFNNAKKIIKASKFVNSDVIKVGGRTFKTSFNKTFVSPYTFQEYQLAKKFIKGNPLLNYSQYGIRTIAGFDDIMDVKNQGKDFLTSVQNKSAKKQEGGLLERKGVPFTAPKPIQPEFPYNGQSMYKGGYNLKRALELYKPDNTGHLPSVDNTNGEWLKDKDYPTSWKELIQTTLNLNLNKQVGFPILNTNGRLQYINKNNK